jgi:hypothetical protein
LRRDIDLFPFGEAVLKLLTVDGRCSQFLLCVKLIDGIKLDLDRVWFDSLFWALEASKPDEGDLLGRIQRVNDERLEVSSMTAVQVVLGLLMNELGPLWVVGLGKNVVNASVDRIRDHRDRAATPCLVSDVNLESIPLFLKTNYRTLFLDKADLWLDYYNY